MAINELVTPLKRQTLSSDVYAQLRELLITGQMIPGEQISLRTTASALGVSVMPVREADRKSTRLNSSHLVISYAVFCLKKKNTTTTTNTEPSHSLTIAFTRSHTA